jgi:monooxygenase
VEASPAQGRYQRLTGMAEHFDVLIIGAGLSGIGAAWRLRRERPGTTYAILEARAAIGGTWDLFRYPGVRSDSDMFTLSYPFRPWQGAETLAAGASIREYIEEMAADGDITPHIRFDSRVESAEFSAGRWSVRLAGGETLTCDFLYACTGYYDYAQGYQPEFPGLAEFTGRVVHPQFWPEDLDYAGKRVVVIGSGATAVTLVPAMAGTAGHVTMLQRSPSYLTVLPERDVVAAALRRVLPARAAARANRAKNVLIALGFYHFSRKWPERSKALLRRFALHHLADPAYVDEHFTPSYQPWDQRLCVVPGGDLYEAINAGGASVVTDHIDRFVPEGIRLRSGTVLPADIVVSATGLSLQALGGIAVTVDGQQIDPGRTVAYRGVMIGGVPNFAFCMGYTNASWTLRADLSHRFVCRLLSYLDKHGYATATPRERPGERRPLLDLSSGYVQRALDRFPKQGDRDPWRVRQNYFYDMFASPRADVSQDMDFTRRTQPAAPAATAVTQ